MPRERVVIARDGTEWTCIQAYAGLKDAPESVTAKLSGADGSLPVTCTPRSGAQSVRLQLPGDWDERLSDDDLVRAIEDAGT